MYRFQAFKDSLDGYDINFSNFFSQLGWTDPSWYSNFFSQLGWTDPSW